MFHRTNDCFLKVPCASFRWMNEYGFPAYVVIQVRVVLYTAQAEFLESKMSLTQNEYLATGSMIYGLILLSVPERFA